MQGLGKCYQPQPLASADKTYLALDNSGYHEKLHPINVWYSPFLCRFTFAL